jgi:hypothetical protein
MASASKTLVVSSLRGGRNGYDPPTEIPADQCREAMNVDWWQGGVANKRGGSTALSMTFSSGGPFTGNIGSLIRHVPAGEESAAELWAFDSAGVNGRLAGATTWTAPTFVDAVVFSRGIQGTSMGGFLHLFYDSNSNRGHLWDGTRVRRSGLATPDPPTVASLGGAGLTVTRFYRIRTVEISGSNTIRRSEASTSVSLSIVDDTGIQVTRPTLPTNEHETHWEVEYAAAAAGPWYRASQVVTATTTYDDTAVALDTTNVSNAAGINTPPPGARFAVTDGNRNVMAGCFEVSGGFTTANNARVWFTPVLGSSDVGDAERIPTTNFLGLEEVPTAIGGPLYGIIYVFAHRRIWKLTPTGDATVPYTKATISRNTGCLINTQVTTGEDEFGNPALYFTSARGPYRIVQNGFGSQTIQFLGLDIDDIWDTVNLDAANMTCHMVYYEAKQQMWFSLATGANNDPDVTLIFDVKEGRGDSHGIVRRGWSRAARPLLARAAVQFSSTVAATMSLALKPYFAMVQANTIWKCDAGTDDAGTDFQAYVDTKEYGEIGKNHAIRQGVLIGEVASGVTITVTPSGDFGLTSGVAGTALLTATASETHVNKRLEGLELAGVGSFRLRIGDASAADNAWTVDAITTHVTLQEDRG